MAKRVLTDTCYWLGLINPDDQHHEDSNTISDLLGHCEVVIPWPCLFETIATRLIRRSDRLLLFERLIKNPSVTLFDDNKYRDLALSSVFESGRRIQGASFSLTDSIIREIIKDIDVRIDYFITFNNRDFQDVCDKRKIPIFNK